MSLLQKIPSPRWLLCDHKIIYIDGFRGNTAKADYRCKDCGKPMSGEEVYGNYTFVD